MQFGGEDPQSQIQSFFNALDMLVHLISTYYEISCLQGLSIQKKRAS